MTTLTKEIIGWSRKLKDFGGESHSNPFYFHSDDSYEYEGKIYEGKWQNQPDAGLDMDTGIYGLWIHEVDQTDFTNRKITIRNNGELQILEPKFLRGHYRFASYFCNFNGYLVEISFDFYRWNAQAFYFSNEYKRSKRRLNFGYFNPKHCLKWSDINAEKDFQKEYSMDFY